MLMLYTYRLTIFDKELQESYTCDHTIIADTTDDRTALLRKSLFDPHECSLTRHILVCARALSLREIAIIDKRMSLVFSVHSIYLTFHRHGGSHSAWLVAPPRIRTNVEVSSIDERVIHQYSIEPIFRGQFAGCERYQRMLRDLTCPTDC
jgi:hypothetical protein